MSDFTEVIESAGTFDTALEEDTGVDFSESLDSSGVFAGFEEDTGVDFEEIGDMGAVIIEGSGFGEGGFGEGPFGGTQTIVLSASQTVWTPIDQP